MIAKCTPYLALGLNIEDVFKTEYHLIRNPERASEVGFITNVKTSVHKKVEAIEPTVFVFI